jgi:hypothetical protein
VVALDQTVEIFILGISLATGAGGDATDKGAQQNEMERFLRHANGADRENPS